MLLHLMLVVLIENIGVEYQDRESNEIGFI